MKETPCLMPTKSDFFSPRIFMRRLSGLSMPSSSRKSQAIVVANTVLRRPPSSRFCQTSDLRLELRCSSRRLPTKESEAIHLTDSFSGLRSRGSRRVTRDSMSRHYLASQLTRLGPRFSRFSQCCLVVPAKPRPKRRLPHAIVEVGPDWRSWGKTLRQSACNIGLTGQTFVL